MGHSEKPEIEAARKGGDIDRPIDGEDLSAESPAVVRRWLRAYAELESLETELLDTLAARTARMSNDARREAAETDRPVLQSPRNCRSLIECRSAARCSGWHGAFDPHADPIGGAFWCEFVRVGAHFLTIARK